jgi:hypothetical protein
MSSLDLSTLDVAEPAEQGTDVELENPFTGEPLLGADDRPVTWTLRGEDSPSVRKVIRKQQDRRNERITKGRGVDLDAKTLEAQATDRLLAATIRYSANFPPLDGEPIPYSESNARKLLTDPRFSWIPEQLNNALGDRKRFLLNHSTP